MSGWSFRRLRNIKILGATLIGALIIFLSGIVAWGGFNTAMEATNTLDFCISCHEMEENVYREYQKTVHYQNRTGVRATCSDCHVPDPWVYKFFRKIQATNELFHWAVGTVDTPEKFEAKRLTLAKHVWATMKRTDSRECRNCHTWEAMADDKQRRRAWKQHQLARDENQTCIDCHKGVAHRPVHELLDDDDDPYDGKPDERALPVAVAEEAAPKEEPAPAAQPAVEPADKAEPAETAATETAATETAATETAAAETTTTEAAATETAAAGTATGDGIDWSGIEGRKITLLYPGETSIEWMLQGSDHGGARAIRKIGDRCGECHEGEQADMGLKMATGEKAESSVIPGKRPAIEVEVKAAHDDSKLYLHFQWPDGEHTPAPFVEGGKMDPANQVKLAFMLIAEENEFATQAGCWATCHHDSRYMPDQPDESAIAAAGETKDRLAAGEGITKYLQETRSDLEIRGADGKPRGGWDKLLPASDIEALLAGQMFADLIRFKAGEGKVENGYVLERRVPDGGAAVSAQGNLSDGQWTVEFALPLAGGGPGDLTLAPEKIYTIGVAIHDDYTLARFHHVSLEYRLGFDNAEAEINAVKR